MEEKRPLGVGAKIWFALMIASQWLMFLYCLSKPDVYMNSVYKEAMPMYFIVGLVGTVLYLWLGISKSKASWITLLAVGGINAVCTLVQGSAGSAVGSLVVLAISLYVSRQAITEES